ncbi:MAG: hypothetical protein CVV64_01270 [Candidatus Wallbacteria bacterium HGW-Wallbacteria-1]|uniref:Uncharacterized protein n=1 Tax=Candidatus Wallbacteria bacterium HGW-Wallbacteria-1 TaxID=2013854 RepID=A0A2N1PUT5_9BACT|nr:MAG: hypothetical protein CVV64_01270 [Candidatus Wallbacteria bacterium HGW-Wallbacteria-1]
MAIDSLSRQNEKLYQIILVLIIPIITTLSGCSALDSRFPGESGPGSSPGIVSVAITNTAPKSLQTGSLGYTSCKVSVTRAEISPDGSSWFDVCKMAGETVELASPSDAMDKLHLLGEKSFNVAESFSRARVHLRHLSRDSSPPVSYTADPANPLLPLPELIVESQHYFTLAQGKTTMLYFDVDSSQDMSGVMGKSTLSGEVRSMFTNIRLFSYLDPESDRDGVWSNGTIFGYYHDNLLKDETNHQIGTIAYQQDSMEGNYLISTGRWKGLAGNFTVYNDSFAKYGRLLFVLGSGYDSGVWVSDRTKGEGYFSLNSIWPYAKSGIIVDTLGIQRGTITLNEKLSFSKIAGDWYITGEDERGKIFVY